MNLNTNQFIIRGSEERTSALIGQVPEDLLGVEDLCEDEDQHDVLVVFPQTVQLRLTQLVQLRHRLINISNIIK